MPEARPNPSQALQADLLHDAGLGEREVEVQRAVGAPWAVALPPVHQRLQGLVLHVCGLQKANCTGLAHIVGQVQPSNRDSQSQKLGSPLIGILSHKKLGQVAQFGPTL
jgi:hypothetical protein